MGYTYAFKNAYRLIIPENLVCLSKGGQSNQRIAQNQTGEADLRITSPFLYHG